MSVEKEIRKILAEATPASARAKQELVRSGLGHDKNASAVMKALQDPEAAMANPAKREMLLKVMQDLLDVVVNDPTMVSKTKSALRKEEVELDEAINPSEIASNPKAYSSDDVKKAYYHKKTTKDDKDALERHLDRHYGNRDWRKSVKEEVEEIHEGYSEDDIAIGGTVIYKKDGKHHISKATHKTGGGAKTQVHTLTKHAVPLHHIVSTDASDWSRFKDKTVKEEVELDEALDPSEIASNPKSYSSDDVKKAYYHKKTSADDKAALERHLDRHYGNRNWRKPVKEEVEELEEKLVGGQKKIDVNKNGKLDAEDFKKLRDKQAHEAKKCDDEENEKEEKGEKEDDEKEMRKNFKGFKKMKEDVQIDEVQDYKVEVTHKDKDGNTGSKIHHLKGVKLRNAAGYIAMDRHRAELKKKGVDVNHVSMSASIVKEGVQVDETHYGAKPPRKGTVAYHAMMKRKEQEKGKQPIEPKDQMVGTAKVTKEETQVDEAFPTVADAKKRMKDALKSKFEKKKISTGTVYTKKYKEDKEDDEKKSDK